MDEPPDIRILYIEDEPVICELFKLAVEAHGYAVDCANCGEQGLSLCALKSYDVVALDYQLPDMTGLEIARVLLADYPALPLLMVTGHGNESLAVEAMTLGISNYVVKDSESVYLTLIPNIISNLLERAKQRRKQIKAERALRESEHRYRNLFSTSPVCMYEIDLDGRIISMNPSGLRMMGVGSEAEVHGMNFLEFPIAADKQRISELLNRARQGEGSQFEFCGDKKNELQYFSSSFEPIRDDDGNVIRTMGVSQDITERKKTEESVRAREELYRQLFERNKAVGLIIDPADGAIFDANNAAIKYYGYTYEHLTSLKISDINILSEAKIDEEKQRARQNKRDHCYFKHKLSSGNVRDVEVHSGPVAIEGRELLYSIIHDITERKRAEEELKASERRFADFANVSSDYFWETGSDLCFSYFSEQFENVTGVPPEELLGKTREEIGRPWSDAYRQFYRCLKRQRPFRDFEHLFYNPSGETVYLSISGKPAYDQNGLFIGFRGTGTDITPSKLAEMALVEKDRLLTGAMESVDGARFALFDEDDRLVLYNTSYKSFFSPISHLIKPGVLYEDIIIGMARAKIFEGSDDSADAWVSSRIKLFHEGKQAEPQKDKFGRWSQPNFCKLKGGGTFIVALNVTDQMMSESSLAEAKRRLDEVMESIEGGGVLFDADARFVMCNQAYIDARPKMKKFLKPGEKFETIIRALVENGYCGEVPKNDTEEWIKTRLEYHGRRSRSVHQRWDGTWWQVDEYPTSDGGTSIIYTEITERKKAEERSEQLLAAVDVLNASVTILDADDRIVFCNKRCLELNSESMVPGTPFEDHLWVLSAKGMFPQALGREEEWIRLRMELHRNPKGPFELAHQDGQWSLVHEQYLPDGGMINLTVDITERKSLETQLTHSQRLDVLGQLTGGVAHDFNNLMAIINLNLEMVADGANLEGEPREMLNRALAAVNKGTRLCDQLLTYACQQALEPATIEANCLLHETIDLLKRTLGEEIIIITEFEDERLFINIDAAIFSNAFVNLSLNARDAMPDGGTLTIRTSSVNLDGQLLGFDQEQGYGQHILITIADTGTGIDEKIIDRVLEPFFTTKEAGKGNGLGLSMVFGFVQQSGGHFVIENGLEKGTVISLYFPIVDERVIETVEKTPFQTVAPKKRTILLVEDDPLVRISVMTLLRKIGHRVIEAADGPSALEILDKESSDIDLVFTDVVMPNNMNGIELAELVAAKHKNIDILLTSGYPDWIADEKTIKTLGFEFLAKPYESVQLSAAIERAASG